MAAQLIEEELFYREAKSTDLLEDEWVEEQVEDATRRILVQAYFRNYITPEAEPDEQELHDYYEAHEDVYTSLAVRRGQHIFSKKKQKLDDILARIVDGGEKFTTMAHKYSEDKITQASGGDLGYFNPGGYIQGVGFSKAFSDTAFQLEPRKLHGPIKWEKGYSLIRVNEKREATVKPYDEVRDEIVQVLTLEKIEDAKSAVTMEIVKRYNVRNYLEERYLAIQRSPTELFNLAQNAHDPVAKIEAYQEIATKFPDDEFAPKALFMVGFVYAEELEDFLTADRVFAEVVSRYPNTDIADQAKWMMENLQSGTPDFEAIEDNLDDN